MESNGNSRPEEQKHLSLCSCKMYTAAFRLSRLTRRVASSPQEEAVKGATCQRFSRVISGSAAPALRQRQSDSAMSCPPLELCPRVPLLVVPPPPSFSLLPQRGWCGPPPAPRSSSAAPPPAPAARGLSRSLARSSPFPDSQGLRWPLIAFRNGLLLAYKNTSKICALTLSSEILLNSLNSSSSFHRFLSVFYRIMSYANKHSCTLLCLETCFRAQQLVFARECT